MTKSRAERYKSARDREQKQKVPRVTSGSYTFAKAEKECVHRNFVLHEDAEEKWNEQTVPASARKMLMADGTTSKLKDIMSGHIRSTKRSADEIAATRLLQIASHQEHGQNHWMETMAIKAALRILDPNNDYHIVSLPDGLGPDFAVADPTSADHLFVGFQVKSCASRDGSMGYSVGQEDGEPGGKYENLPILAVALHIEDRNVIKNSRLGFDHVPDVPVAEILLYKHATHFPNKTLAPYPRRVADDIYGDNRYVVGFDSLERLEIMRANFRRIIISAKKWTLRQLWFDNGPGTASSIINSKHATEMSNCCALADLVGFANLRAPLFQHETTDVIWRLNGRDIKISLKTSTVIKKGFQFGLEKHPKSEWCDFVLVFYRTDNNVTHISVICARRVYAREAESFCWSPIHEHNSDVFDNRIDVRSPNALQMLMNHIGK
jgi:hypothetical protein